MGIESNFFLATRLRSGDSKAYDFLMDSYYQNLYAYAYTLVHDRGKAEDIVQNVFVKIWINRKKINPDFSIKNYLYKSVYNESIDLFRKRKPIIYLEKKYLEAIDLVVENEPENLDELIKLVYAEIHKLPKKCQRIFLLSKKEGLTHIEISEFLGISTKTVENQMTKAFKILAEKLSAKMETLLFLLFDHRAQGATVY